MDTLKQEALTAIEQLPETADIDAIMYKLYMIDKVRKGRGAHNHTRIQNCEPQPLTAFP